ncbi:MAG: ketoacyl-ACP synthase III [Rhodobacteraceae bacterium]|nr:ketoacyl-ACP synthase III [Paracoccaceae bacterium]MCY4195330.1 ketoacyl-ACP synthase III [Paracoccaceae bacterium]
MIRSLVRGIGHYLPDRVVENSEFEEFLDTTDEWILTRTGISQRHFAAPDQLTSDLATRAGWEALENASFDPADIDLVVLATSTPDLTFPSTATRVQNELGMTRGFAFDIQAVCSGFVYALANANAHLIAGHARRALVIGAEIFSRILDMDDRATCILFGDGAGAIVLEASESEESGILATDLHSDGKYRDLLYVDGGVAKTQSAGQIRMNGKELFRHAVEKLTESTETSLRLAGLTIADVDVMVPHQANYRIMQATARRLNFPIDRMIVTVGHHGNTSAASIPLALYSAHEQDRLHRGDVVVVKAIGGGLTWGSAVIRW